MKKYFPSSELILHDDGSVFHLCLLPHQLAEKVIVVGDPGRVDTVASYFDTKECDIQSREFHTITGSYKGKRLTVLSTGIGCDNIDIVVNELDALVNIDLRDRTPKAGLTSLEIVRVGTCGSLQPDVPIGSFIASQKSIGFDGLLNFYAGRNEVCDLGLEQAFKQHMHWNPLLCAPYVIDADHELLQRVAGEDMLRGITIACGGFYGPQGRELRIGLADPEQNAKVQSFRYNGLRVLNYEMESSALAGLSRLLGHRAMTCCMAIAGRATGEADTGYRNTIGTLIEMVLERI